MFYTERNDEETIEVISKIASNYQRIHGSSKTAALATAIEKGDWHSVVNWNFDYNDSSTNVSEFLTLRQLQAFFRKLQCLPLGIDKEAVAVEKFLACEDDCRKTNDLFSTYATGRVCLGPDVESVLLYARLKIAEVLGGVPKLDKLRLAFTPGATTSVKKRNSCSREKLTATPSCSANMVPIMGEFLRALPHYAKLHSNQAVSSDGWTTETVDVDVHDAIVGFAAKDASTFRTTVTQPTCNGMLQAGYGEYMKGRLKRVGVDITDQTLNQRLAREGSITGELCTIDLRSASDSIAMSFVEYMLPFDWFTVLDFCRTPRVTLPNGSLRHLEQFSSMGNGYTFPLQTLIFWAIVKSVCDHGKYRGRVSVYGDDIIAPVAAYDLIERVFNVCGFNIHPTKSYVSGPFRESCGADYFNGIDIRPKYMKKNISYASLFGLHNFFVRNFDQEMAEVVLGFIPEHVRLWGPDGFGDGHLLSDAPPARQYKRDLGFGGWLFDTYASLSARHKTVLPGDAILPAYTIYASGVTELVCSKHGEIELHIVTPMSSTKKGVKTQALPDVLGSKRITIYTLEWRS